MVQDLRYLDWSKTRDSSGTAGSYLKSYSYSNGKKVYYKLSFFDDQRKIFGYESINEIISAKILEKLGYPYLNYNLVYAKIKIKTEEYETYLTKSFDFKEENEEKITFENYYNFYKEVDESILDFSKKLGFIDDIYHLIIFDYIIGNRDRHGANIEILLNKKTKRIRLAPFFDNGLSLLSPIYLEEDINKFDIKKNIVANSFIGTSNLLTNLDLVPMEYFPKIKLDFNDIINSLNIPDCIYLRKAKKMLEWRYSILEDIRDKRQKI